MNNTPSIPKSEEQMFRALLLLSGHTVADFSVEADRAGHVRVRGPHGTATYASRNWTAQFGKHLYEGLFDELVV
jgi:hypothetical protein